MADIGQVLATGGTALVSVAAGAGLTYWLGSLNRRHQEAREDKTRWYEARFKAYAEMSRAYSNCLRVALTADANDDDARSDAAQELSWAAGAIRFVGSAEVVAAAEDLVTWLIRLLESVPPPTNVDSTHVLHTFEAAARKDLGHPSP